LSLAVVTEIALTCLSRSSEEPVGTTGSTLEYIQLCQLDAGGADVLRRKAGRVTIARVGLSLTVTNMDPASASKAHICRVFRRNPLSY
jgi:hypothetical protein